MKRLISVVMIATLIASILTFTFGCGGVKGKGPDKKKQTKKEKINKSEKDALKNYGKTDEKRKIIENWAKDRRKQVDKDTDVCPRGWKCDVFEASLKSADTNNVVEVPSVIWETAGLNIRITATAPKGIKIFAKLKIAATGRIPSNPAFTPGDSDNRKNVIDSNSKINTQNPVDKDTKVGAICDLIYVKVQIWEDRGFWKRDKMQCEKKVLFHLAE